MRARTQDCTQQMAADHIGREIVSQADSALASLEAALALANDLPQADRRKAVSAALYAVKVRLRETLPHLRSQLMAAGESADDSRRPPRLQGSRG